MPVGGIAWTAEVYPGQLEINGDLCCAHDGIPPEVMELEWLGNYTDKVEVLPYMRQGPSWRHPPWIEAVTLREVRVLTGSNFKCRGSCSC